MKLFKALLTFFIITILSVVTMSVASCTPQSTTSTSVTETRSINDAHDYDRNGKKTTVAVTKTENITSKEAYRGFFGILWDIICLPFKAIGAIL
jgi:hypothetical protein